MERFQAKVSAGLRGVEEAMAVGSEAKDLEQELAIEASHQALSIGGCRNESTRVPTLPNCVTKTNIRSANVWTNISVEWPSSSREIWRVDMADEHQAFENSVLVYGLGMFHDVKPVPISPQKGKAREKQNWQTGWWDFQPLAERSLRPVEWSPSSVIFSAHPAQPLVTARHFSSSKQFVIPSPTPIISSPASYGPPTVISVAPGDDWLFAYFPGHNVDGTGCLWKRGSQIDNWNVKEWWTFPQGGGVVAISWLGTTREWVAGNAPGSSTRLPPRGPRTPVSSPTLLLVTQDHHVKIYYFRYYNPAMMVLSRSIAQSGTTVEGSPQLGGDANSSGIRQCFRAAIGLGYNGTSYYTPPPLINTQFTLNANLPEDMNQPLPPNLQAMEWENWGEEVTINLCEIHLRYNGTNIGFVVEMLPPIRHCGSTLVDLNFISIPPSLDVQKSSSSPRKNYNERGQFQFYLTSSFLNFDDYNSPPKSELVVHSVGRPQTSPGSNSPKPTWKFNKTAVRSFTPSVLTFISHSTVRSDSGRPLIYAGIVDTSGILPRAPSRIKKASVGNIRVLNLSDLTDNEDYQPSPILCDVDKMGQDPPFNAVLSPNGAFLCTISSSLWPVRTSIQSLPSLKDSKDASGKQIYPLAAPLASAVISGRPAIDITHALALASIPLSDVLDTLYQTNHILEGHRDGFSHAWTLELLGEIMAVYRERSLCAQDEEKYNLTMRWKTAHDICSLSACNKAFEDCQDGETYDLDAVWQLIGLLTWVVSFTEKVLKQCVLSSDLAPGDVKKEIDDKSSVLDLSRLSPPLDVPVLLHLGHPFALKIFMTALSHVQRCRAYVGSLSARGENAQIARDVLVDLVDSSGVDFAALKTALVPTLEEMQAFDRDSCRRALISCRPTPAMHLHLSKVIQKVTQPSVLNKPILFIKPQDLVDGVARLCSAPKKDRDKDVHVMSAVLGRNYTDQRPFCWREYFVTMARLGEYVDISLYLRWELEE
ncbi:hypothetical protein D9615_004015 [Tricholomella constricta]|uniref:Uncharacterized protein n=1 Tax=Tricholomella constricta TaxID=117010 RepID=A0A8H5M4N5_9AGAR|nr:hypothetical protein D9615_004015 [Tricholomella constricta]